MKDKIKQIFRPNVAQVGMGRGVDEIKPSVTNDSDDDINDDLNRATIELANPSRMGLTVIVQAYEGRS